MRGRVPEPPGLSRPPATRGSSGAEPHRDGDVCTVLSLLPPARQLGYSFLPVVRVDPATIVAAGHRQVAARILRAEVCNRSDDDNPPLERS